MKFHVAPICGARCAWVNIWTWTRSYLKLSFTHHSDMPLTSEHVIPYPATIPYDRQSVTVPGTKRPGQTGECAWVMWIWTETQMYQLQHTTRTVCQWSKYPSSNMSTHCTISNMGPNWRTHSERVHNFGWHLWQWCKRRREPSFPRTPSDIIDQPPQTCKSFCLAVVWRCRYPQEACRECPYVDVQRRNVGWRRLRYSGTMVYESSRYVCLAFALLAWYLHPRRMANHQHRFREL